MDLKFEYWRWRFEVAGELELFQDIWTLQNPLEDVFMNEGKYTANDLKFKANEWLKVIGMIGLTR